MFIGVIMWDRVRADVSFFFFLLQDVVLGLNSLFTVSKDLEVVQGVVRF